MSKKNKRGNQKSKVFLTPAAYAFSLRRKTKPMTDEEIAAVVTCVKDYDPDGSRGLEIVNAALDACKEARRLLDWACYRFREEAIPKMVARMKEA